MDYAIAKKDKRAAIIIADYNNSSLSQRKLKAIEIEISELSSELKNTQNANKEIPAQLEKLIAEREKLKIEVSSESISKVEEKLAKLEEEAKLIQQQMKQIQQAKLEAEKMKQEALEHASALKEKQMESTSSQKQRDALDVEIKAAEEKAVEKGVMAVECRRADTLWTVEVAFVL